MLQSHIFYCIFTVFYDPILQFPDVAEIRVMISRCYVTLVVMHVYSDLYRWLMSCGVSEFLRYRGHLPPGGLLSSFSFLFPRLQSCLPRLYLVLYLVLMHSLISLLHLSGYYYIQVVLVL